MDDFVSAKLFPPLISKTDIFSSRKAVHDMETIENDVVPCFRCCRVFFPKSSNHPSPSPSKSNALPLKELRGVKSNRCCLELYALIKIRKPAFSPIIQSCILCSP